MRIIWTALCLTALAGCSCRRGDDPVTAQLTVARVMRVSVLPSAPSTLEPVARSDAKTAIAAPVRSVLVHVGDQVSAGDLLALLDNRDLLAQRESALAAVAGARASVAAINAATNAAAADRTKAPNVLRDAALRRLQDAERAFDAVNQRLALADVTAPMSGTVIAQLKAAGDDADAGAPVFTIADLSTMVARARLNGYAQWIADRLPCEFQSSTPDSEPRFGRTSAKPAGGAVTDIACTIANDDASLDAGTAGTVLVHTGVSRDAVMVPSAAVHKENDSGKSWVFVVDGKQTAHARTVRTGIVHNDYVELVSGVRAGEKVVSAGDNLRENVKVRLTS